MKSKILLLAFWSNTFIVVIQMLWAGFLFVKTDRG